VGRDEQKMQSKVFRELQKIPCSYWFKLDQRARRGDPDIIGCLRGRFVAIEVKCLDGCIRRLQIFRLKQMENAGAITSIISNDEQLEAMVLTFQAITKFVDSLNKKKAL